MAVTEKDIYASAIIFIKQHGDQAIPRALEMIRAFEAKGDIEGRECWNQIAGTIKAMTDTRNDDETVN